MDEWLQNTQVDALSPFTHPSFALEMRSKNDWIKVLSCGIMRPEISSGAESNDRVSVPKQLCFSPSARIFFHTSNKC